MKKQKITRAEMDRQDVVREVEMTVDSIANFNIGVTIQFWKDVSLYGLDEARTYLHGYCPDADFTDLDSKIERIRGNIGKEVVDEAD